MKKCLEKKKTNLIDLVALDGHRVICCIVMVAGRFGLAELVTQVPKPPVIRQSDFDLALKCRWNSAADAGLCRYRLNRLQNKLLPGRYGFVAQVSSRSTPPLLLCRYSSSVPLNHIILFHSTTRKNRDRAGGGRARIYAKSTFHLIRTCSTLARYGQGKCCSGRTS